MVAAPSGAVGQYVEGVRMSAPAGAALAVDHVVIGAADLDATVAFFDALGLTLHDRRKVDADEAAALHGLDAVTEEVMCRAPGADRAGVRVVATPLAAADRDDFFRGGHAIDLYTTDMARSVEVALAAGATVGPVVDYTFGPVHLTQAMAVGPDGIDVVFVGIDHRLPSLLDTEPDRLHSDVHSVVVAIDDHDAEVAFWSEFAGLEVRSRFPIDIPAVSDFMMLPRHAPVTLTVMTGPAAAPPRFELMSYDDAPGRLVPGRPLTAGSVVPVFEATAGSDDTVARLVAGGATIGDPVEVATGSARWLRSPGGVDAELRIRAGGRS